VNIGAQSGLLAAIVSVAVALSVVLRARRGLISTLFTLFAANLFTHYLAAFLHQISRAPIMRQVDLISAALLPVTALLFFGHFLWQQPEHARRILRVFIPVSALLVVLLVLPFSRHPLVSAFVLVYTFAGLYLCAWLIHLRQQELDSKRERTRLRYLLVFHLVAVSFVLLGMLPAPLDFLRTWGNLVSVFFLYFVSQSLLKYRLLDLQELLGRTLVLTAVALILAVVFGVLVLWAGGAPEVSLFHTFVASIVILILFEPLRDQVEHSTRRLFFRERYELRRQLEQLRREVANILQLERLARVLVETPYDSLGSTHASLFLQEEGGASYRLLDHRGPAPVERLDVTAHRAFFEELERRPSAVLAEAYERQLTDEGAPAESEPAGDAPLARQVIESMNALQAGICIPLAGRDEVLGLWCLHDENGLESYSANEIALLVAIGEQAAINIENTRLFERIRERDRLAVLGEMAAGLAHEIRNPLGAIKGAAQYLEPGTAEPEEDEAEFLGIIVEEVDRLDKVVNQFLDYARPFKADHEPTDLTRVAEQTVRLTAPGLAGKDIELRLELESELAPVQGNEPQLRQVALNLINNAVEAMPRGGQLTIRTRMRGSVAPPRAPERPRGARVQLEISDTGAGITPEQLNTIFVPFYTTKERGTGLGLPICQRIVEHHGGEIRIQSEPGRGSRFLVELPAEPLGQPESTALADETAAEADPADLPLSSEHGSQ